MGLIRQFPAASVFAITRCGVLPRVLRLANGVIVLSSGRPGVQVRFCTDGKGEVWTDAFEMLAYHGDADAVSCGYTALLATGPDRFSFLPIPTSGTPTRQANCARQSRSARSSLARSRQKEKRS